MIAVSDAFKKFKSRLELTEGEQKDASRRHKDVREFLRKSFDVETDFLTGSYDRWTKTKPLKDIDIFFVLGQGEEGYRHKGPAVILEKFRKVLVPQYRQHNVSLGRRSVSIDFGIPAVEDSTGDQVMSIDVVPAFRSDSHFQIPDRETQKWVFTDPMLHAKLATEANKAFSEEWKPLVKMIKKWNETNEKPVVPNFLLEVMALKLFVPPFSGGYPYELKGFFATASDRIGEVWPDPANVGPPVSDQMDAGKVQKSKSELRRAEETVSRAIRLGGNEREGSALQEWRKLFGPLFPLS